MESVFDYIESNLTQEISITHIAKLAGCSEYNFERVFSFIMGISLSEYIRNRKMSESVADIISGERIIDTAIKYGYNSQEAFSRAFKRVHGFNPGQVKENSYTAVVYPRAKLYFTEEEEKMNNTMSEFILPRKPSVEQFKHRTPSPVTLNFPVSMRTYMEYMGQNTDTMRNHTLLSNLCGDTCGAGLELATDDGIILALDTFGYECEIYSTQKGASNYMAERELTEKIIKELTVNKRPVISVNVVDCCFGGAIIGYKDNGKCLMNWGFFPFDTSENPEPIITDCYDWYKKTEKVIFVSDRKDNIAELAEIYKLTFRKMSDYLGSSECLVNKAFYDIWRKRLTEVEDELSDEGSIVDPMWCDYAEKRFYAGQFVLQLREYYPQFDSELIELWKIFGEKINGLMYEYIAQVGLNPGEELQKANFERLKNKEVRCKMIEIVNRCEELEREAADTISKLTYDAI